MLRSFRATNHRSIRAEAELLLMPTYDIERPVVPVAAIFGANASGKSNLLDALRFMQTAVRTSYAAWEPGSGIPRTPFRLDPAAADEPSVYVVGLLLNGVRCTYGVELDDWSIRAEWLYAYPHHCRRTIFERTGQDIRLGSTLADHRSRGDLLARLTRDNALFLSAAARANLAEVQSLYGWFLSGLAILGAELFHDGRTNGHGAQLVFTTHDATLLGTSFGRDLLRRDQIWFAESDAAGATALFSLTDFRPGSDEDTERRYLGGSYGAVPAVFSDSLVKAYLATQRRLVQ